MRHSILIEDDFLDHGGAAAINAGLRAFVNGTATCECFDLGRYTPFVHDAVVRLIEAQIIGLNLQETLSVAVQLALREAVPSQHPVELLPDGGVEPRLRFAAFLYDTQPVIPSFGFHVGAGHVGGDAAWVPARNNRAVFVGLNAVVWLSPFAGAEHESQAFIMTGAIA